MSIALPNNRKEKWERYMMLVDQGSMTYAETETAYIEYLKNTNQTEED